MATKFFLYARKSSEAEERQAMSIEAQIQELTELADREKLVVAETFIESKSAKIPGRKEFARMIEKIHASKEPVGILSWHPDRLARNSIDGGQIIYLIDKEKISALRFPTFWFETTPQGLFMLQVAFGQSKYYSDNLAENVKRGFRQKLRRGEWLTLAPLGYVNNAKTRNIEPDEVKAKIVQMLYKEFAEGKHNLESARHRLSFWGVVSHTGTLLGKSAVQRILTSPVYTGRITHKGETYQGNFAPLVSNEIFEAVQARLKDNGKPRKSKHRHNFPFTGLIKCSECGGAITAQYGKGNGGVYIYYRCSKKLGKCKQAYLRSESLVEQLRAELQKISLSDAWAASGFAQLKEWENEERGEVRSFAQNLEKSLSLNKTKLDKVVNLFLEGLIEKENYLQKKDELIKEKIDLESNKVGFGQKSGGWVEPMKLWLESAHNAHKLAFSNNFYEVKSLIEKIGSNRLLENKKVVITWVQPFDILLKYKEIAGEEEGQKEMGLATNYITNPMLSGWQDSNLRPSAPKADALAGLRYTPINII